MGPYLFAERDLEASRLEHGVRCTLADFRRWRDENPDAVAAHVQRYQRQVGGIRKGFLRHRRAARLTREIAYFGVYNLSEIIPPSKADQFASRVPRVRRRVREDEIVPALERRFPTLRGIPERKWLQERLDRLYRTLPEAVIQAGGMGKVTRSLVGVLAIAAYDTLDADRVTRREHLSRVMPAAYAFGASYAIIDDTLQDMPGDYLSRSDRDTYHRMIATGLATGDPLDAAAMPDHPLAEELFGLYELLLTLYPFQEYRHLYAAAEAMYHAQHRDASRKDGTLAELYPDIFIKSGMSRVVANILGRRNVADGFYARCLNTVLTSQFKDDLADRHEDRAAGRITPFTTDNPDGNALYDLFAYDAYVCDEVFQGEPTAVEAMTHFGAMKLVTHLTAAPQHLSELLHGYAVTPEIAQFLTQAAAASKKDLNRLTPTDMLIKHTIGQRLRTRRQTSVDPRTFVGDRLQYINGVLGRHKPVGELSPFSAPKPSARYPQARLNHLGEIVAYTLDGSGKRLRPALTLMLATSLNLPYQPLEPLLAAIELFHTASLVFDDLPAQDNALVRRGRPAAHTVFDEGSVQLAAISMLSTGFGLLARLSDDFPADVVADVIAYVGVVMGPDRLCRGQNLDLHLGRDGIPVSGPEIMQMYELKTSTMLEASLVPLMMLLSRPEPEIHLMRRYSYHAGLVFQLRDDILDATSTTHAIGKDADHDTGKVNLVRVYGLAEARRIMQSHVDDALAACAALPFDTDLLTGMVRHFAARPR